MQAFGERFQACAPRSRSFEGLGQGGKTRYIPLHPAADGLVLDYLEESAYGIDLAVSLFQPIPNNRTDMLIESITEDMAIAAALLFSRVRI